MEKERREKIENFGKCTSWKNVVRGHTFFEKQGGADIFRNMSSVSLTEVSPAPLAEVTAQMVLEDHKKILGATVSDPVITDLHVPLEAVNLLWVVVDKQGNKTDEYALVAAHRPKNGTEVGFLGGKVPRVIMPEKEGGEQKLVDYNPDGQGPYEDQLRTQQAKQDGDQVLFLNPVFALANEIHEECCLPQGSHGSHKVSAEDKAKVRPLIDLLLKKGEARVITTTKKTKVKYVDKEFGSVELDTVETRSHIVLVMVPVTLEQLREFDNILKWMPAEREARQVVVCRLEENGNGFKDFQDVNKKEWLPWPQRKTVTQLFKFNGERMREILVTSPIVAAPLGRSPKSRPSAKTLFLKTENKAGKKSDDKEETDKEETDKTEQGSYWRGPFLTVARGVEMSRGTIALVVVATVITGVSYYMSE